MAVTLHTTLGDLKLELACAQVPKQCENFLALCACGAYDNTVFHRNIRGFIVQGGDPTGSGKGGESVWGGTLPDAFHPELRHDRRGVVSMATSKPDTIGSQFFITYARQNHLNNVNTVIGHVIDGMPVLDAMEAVPVTGKKYRPTTDIKVLGVTIHANPLAK